MPRPPRFSNLAGAEVDFLNVVAPANGEYQLEIVGSAAAEFALEVHITPAAVAAAANVGIAGVDPTKAVRAIPLVSLNVMPSEQFSLTPPIVNQPANQIYLPTVQR